MGLRDVEIINDNHTLSEEKRDRPHSTNSKEDAATFENIFKCHAAPVLFSSVEQKLAEEIPTSAPVLYPSQETRPLPIPDLSLVG